MEEITEPLLADLRQTSQVRELGGALFEMSGEEIGDRGLLSPDERAGMFQAELLREFRVEQFKGVLRRELGGPQFVVGGHGERRIIPEEDGVAVIDRMEEGDGVPDARLGVAFHADLEAEHQVEIRQPGLPAAFAREDDVRLPGGIRLRVAAVADVLLQVAEPVDPVRTAPDGMTVGRVVAGQAGAGLIHIDGADAEAGHGLFRKSGVGIAPE
ncbi:MAG: hypothetical protein BWY59_00574 [Verrucomicrobia bacterium ADurb.Bin345]|nr:MAG: hypothetical protein BWY59_00574 [Verrucomicrobia bacterium ADurb.Bin345]